MIRIAGPTTPTKKCILKSKQKFLIKQGEQGLFTLGTFIYQTQQNLEQR